MIYRNHEKWFMWEIGKKARVITSLVDALKYAIFAFIILMMKYIQLKKGKSDYE